MTVAYSVNGGNEIHGVLSSWLRQVVRREDDGTIVYSNFAANRWIIRNIDMTEFDALRALQGTSLTSLETNDIDDRNAGATYTTVFVTAVINGQQIGREMRNVQIEFRVKVT